MRTLLAGLGALAIIGTGAARADWPTFAANPQHTSLSNAAAQPLQTIRWSTPVDLAPPTGSILIHYGSPLVTPGNTVVVPVKTGSSGGYRVEARRAGDGVVRWSADTDYILPPHTWTPSYSPTLTADQRVYFAGAGGTVYFRDAADSDGSLPISQRAFYGLASYQAARASFDATVFIDTPITADSAGTIYFGFRASAGAPLGLQSGIARIDANGNGSWVSAVAASGGDASITRVPHQAAPALSADEQTLYVVVASANNATNHYLVGLNPATLALRESSPGVPMRVALKDPRNGGANNASVLDESSASPMVGPDGDVYYGVMGNPFNVRGWLLHFSANLAQTKTPGGFGWDTTPSVVPAAAVPSYAGGSAYLLFTKYNNYAGLDGGDGVNRMVVLDPNATMVEPHASSGGLLVMKEILAIAGPTPDPEHLAQYPNAVREWCINSAAVDPATRSVMANSEDGKLYRWDLATNTLSPGIALSPGIGEAYTPTVIGPDGTVYAINWAILNAVGLAPTPSPTPLATPTCIPGGDNGISGQVRAYHSGRPVGGATVRLSGGTTATTQTDATGHFAFTGLDGCHVHLEVDKLGDVDSGISTLDAAYTLQAVAGLRTLDAEQRLACDVSGNGALSTLDATFILQQRVGLLATFPAVQACASDWHFVPSPAAAANQTVLPPENIGVNACRRGAIDYAPLSGQATGQDFAAVLIGDCTANWQPAP
ncbi:dockerin type I repeat-containing protein [bacterium]|nr:dockerin type I repeat-containing protein [bacterium]